MLQFLDLQPLGDIVVSFLFPYNLLLKIDDCISYFFLCRFLHLYQVIDLRKSVHLYLFFVPRYGLQNIRTFLRQFLYLQMAYFQNSSSHRRVVDALVIPPLLIHYEILPYYAALAEDIQDCVQVLAIRDDDVHHAMEDNVNKITRVIDIE